MMNYLNYIAGEENEINQKESKRNISRGLAIFI